ncbi:MAG: 3-isopropylmalate dehydratase small subunit, partial [Candidatus Thioglobus sp.]|nr:3-isopropylmalate dehydratase small subunit [Candidatus Thioglobus sp.]
YNNCFKNGVLPIVLSSEIVDSLFSYSGLINIDLEKQIVKIDQNSFEFEVDPERKRRLINGLDDIGLTLQNENQIRIFETAHFAKYPWL